MLSKQARTAAGTTGSVNAVPTDTERLAASPLPLALGFPSAGGIAAHQRGHVRGLGRHLA